jgi:hypothetical protein
MSEQVVIERRFNGPPSSAHGGYACAVAAQFLDWSAEVSLLRPPPLGQPLEVRQDDGRVELVHDGEPVISARSAKLSLEIPEPISPAEAEAAAAACPWHDRHPFPSCFGCGSERPEGDGLFEFPGPVAGRPRLWAAVWWPHESFADGTGDVEPIYTFAALDCPSAAGAINAIDGEGVHVLGRMTGRVVGTVRAGEPQTVITWPVRQEGRKRYGGVAIFSGRELRAFAEALWIQLRDPDRFEAREPMHQ